MKTLFVGLLIFSMLIPSLIAVDANIYEASDFNEYPEQRVVLKERDMIRINWEGKDHQVHVRQIYLDKKKVDLTAFIQGSEVPFYTVINPKTSLQLDFDRDGIYDLKASIFNMLEEDGKKFIALKLEKLENIPVTSQVIIENKPAAKQPFISKYTIYSLLGIILICLIVWKRRTLLKLYKKQ